MREGWNNCKLGELLEIKYGKDHKKLNDGKYPLYGSGGIMRYVDQYLYDDESILIPRKGTLTNLFYLNSPFSTVDTMFWSKINKEKIFPKFLYYLLKTYDFSTLDEGAAIPSLTTKTLKEVLVKIPESLETQRKIASILSGYDDLIENNLKRIKILEEMAQQTYEEWFVRMRFPGFETANINDETGLPEGWEKVKLNEIADFQNGYAFYTKGYSEKGYAIIDLGNVSEYGDLNISGNEKLISTELYHSLPKFHLKKHDIVIAMTDITSSLRILAKSAIIDKDDTYALNQRVGMLRPKTGLFNFAFLYALLSDYRFIERMKAMSKGAVQFYFNTKDIVNYETFLPPKDIIDDFVNVYEPYLNTRMLLKDQNQRLRETRDLLLPRLMMGILEV